MWAAAGQVLGELQSKLVLSGPGINWAALLVALKLPRMCADSSHAGS